MADRGDTHYHLPSLNAWFLISSALLLVTTVWMVFDDYNRPWKGYQRQFRELEVSKAEEEIESFGASGVLDKERGLQETVAQAESALTSRESELANAEEELRAVRGTSWRANEQAKKAKAGFNWERFLVEEERVKLGDPAHGAERLALAEQEMNRTAMAYEEAGRLLKSAEAKVAVLTADVESKRSELAAETRDLARVRARIEQLRPSERAGRLAQVVRDDIPGLDFIGPTIKVAKVLPPDLTFELNFTKKARIDMCQTCHMGIDRPGFEEDAEPFRSHPRLDLYLSSKSPHPARKVGCTICHRGAGEALDFVRADHRPNSPEEEEKWYESHHWHKQHHWDYPMLASDFVEASCVQCHKDSMELIAEDAPRLSQGYQLFERYGCYACHKVDWFPTKRRPGPSLANFQVKFGPEFLASWVADPHGFRPTTWMPQLFHLENFAPDEVVAESKYGAGRAIRGAEWNDTAVDAIAAFLLDRAPVEPLPAIPVTGDAHRGREVMRLSGCFACHNTAPYGDEEPETWDPTLRAKGRNEHGPNLRGVATKVTPQWLFHWIKDPSAYWPDTRMPNLRLSDQDAADIAAFMAEDPDGIFRDVPDGWQAQSLPSDTEVLQEQARWFFARDGRATVENRLTGGDSAYAWDDVEVLKVAVGEKLVAHYGCFSCHEIRGMEDMMPIGTELSNWGSKTVDKLDFGFAYKKELAGAPLLNHEYREGWLMRKLDRPRSYDLEKIKNPIEKLRMGWFGLSTDEIQAISTLVVGMVDDEVSRARFRPSSEKKGMDTGLRAIRQKNCLACHVADPGTVTYRAEDGEVRTVKAELLPLEDDFPPIPPPAEGLKSYLEEKGAEEFGLRLLAMEPGLGDVGNRFFVKTEDLISATPAKGGDFVDVITAYYLSGGIEFFDPEAAEDEAYSYVTADPDDGGAVQDVDQKFRAYFNEPYDKVRWTFAPPVLLDEGFKVQRDWFYSFLNDVQPIRPQLRVRMPSFHFDEGETESIVDYLAHKSAGEWPARYARALRQSIGESAAGLGQAAGLDERVVRAIENGARAETAASFEKLRALGDARGFIFRPPVDPAYESVLRRSRTYLEGRQTQIDESPMVLGERLAVQAVNCYQCHFRFGAAPPDQPIAWAPDLAAVHERLREDWVHEWLIDPQRFYAGTSMPANFSAATPQYQDVYPNSSNDDQIQAVLDWMFNFDRYYSVPSERPATQ